ncbi:MAG: translocation/assembly module TamB domain-containing protein [Desulfobacterales bacterium]|nr:translocation/assembly module TamB domain-containing protein [Desulfobacterales bacterium]
MRFLKKIFKYFFRTIGVVFLIAVLVICGILFYINTAHCRNFALSKLNKSIPGTVLIGDHDISMFKGCVELNDFHIKDELGKDITNFKRFFVNISILKLLLKTIRIEAIDLEKPNASIEIDNEGQINIAKAFISPSSKPEEKKEEPPSEGGAPLNIEIDNLNISDGDISFKTKDFESSLNDINILADAKILSQSGNLNFKIGNGNFKSNDINALLKGFSVTAKLDNGSIKEIKVKADSDLCKIDISGSIKDILTNPYLDITTSIKADISILKKIVNKEFSGEIYANITAKGSIENPDLNIALEYKGGSLAGNQVDKIELNLSMSQLIAKLNNLSVTRNDANIALKGTVDLRKAFQEKGLLSKEPNIEQISCDLNLKVLVSSLSSLVAGLGVDPFNGTKEISGEVYADINTKGLIKNPDLNIVFEYKGGSLAGNQVDKIVLDLSMSQLIAKLNNLSLTRNDANIVLNGTADLSKAFQEKGLLSKEPDIEQISCDLNLNVLISSLSSLLSGLGIDFLKGNVDLKAHLAGTVKQPELDTNLKAKELAFNDISIGDVLLEANINKSGEINISELTVNNKRSAITISGIIKALTDSFKPLEDPSFKLAVKGETIFIDDFIEQIKGNLSIIANLDGSLNNPYGKIKINGKGFDISGQQKIKSINLLANFEGEKITINPLKIAITEKEFIECTGWVSKNKEYNLALKSTNISLKSFDALKAQKDIDGNIFIDFSGISTFDNPKVNGKIVLSSLKVKDKALNDISFEIKLADYIAKLNGWADFKINGFFDIKQKDFGANVLFKETKLDHYFIIAGVPDFKGQIDGSVEVKGNVNEIDKVKVSLVLSSINILFKDKELLSSNDLQAYYFDKEVSIPGIMLELLKEGKIQVSGKGRIDGDANFSFKGRIPLSIATAFTDEVPDITGYLNFDGNLDGNITNPSIKTEIVLEKIGLTIPGIYQKLHDVNGNIKLTQDLVNIESLSGELDSGKFDIYGKITLENFMPSDVQINLKANSMPINVPDMLSILFNAGIKLSGTPDKSSIRGDIVLLEGNYYKDVSIDFLKIATEKKRQTAPPPSEITNPFLKNLRLDIAVKSRGAFIVDNNIADLTITPDVKISGKINNPIINGRANIDSGSITYQKKTFEVKKGVIDFLNPYKIEPTLDIKSETKIRDWIISLEIMGTPDALSFKLSSIPQEDDASILSLLLLGRTPKEFTKGDGGVSQSSEQMAAEMLVSTFGDDIKKNTGLDTIQLETKDTNGSNTNGNGSALDGMKITIGKQLSKRMSVKYSVESKDGEMVQTASSEYKLLENIMLNGFQNTTGVFGGKVVFRLEFR